MDIANWLNEYEIYDVNLDNAFDLLSSFDGGAVNNNTLEFGLEAFRKYSARAATILPEPKVCVDRHTKLAVNTFIGTPIQLTLPLGYLLLILSMKECGHLVSVGWQMNRLKA